MEDMSKAVHVEVTLISGGSIHGETNLLDDTGISLGEASFYDSAGEKIGQADKSHLTFVPMHNIAWAIRHD